MSMIQMTSFRRSMQAGSALAALSICLLAVPAAAQNAQAEAAAEPAIAAGEIVVTAQRREQKLNDVGIAVSVLSAKEIKALNIVNATDVVRPIPNLKFQCPGSSHGCSKNPGLLKQ